MRERKRYRIVLKLGSEVFAGLGYFLALSASQNLFILTNDLIFCIVCLVTAYKCEQYLDDDDF